MQPERGSKTAATATPDQWVVYGSELSPFTLKTQLLCRQAGIRFRFLPTAAGPVENLKLQWRLRRLIYGQLPLTWPDMTEEDEFPLVPYLFGPQGQNLYDSSAIADWLDRRPNKQHGRFRPQAAAAAFVTRLIDDYADEFGLYLVHHQRWVVSSRDNTAGRRLAQEWRSLLGPLQPAFGAWFSARQVRRLPYLFSIAESGARIDGLPRWRHPPGRADFPPTHSLLESAFLRLLSVLDELLRERRFILGDCFSLADAAVYGALGMNLSDPSSEQLIASQAPQLHQWLRNLHHGEVEISGDAPVLGSALAPLLKEICRTHVPLMQQNYAACEAWQERGAIRFNESAFNRGQALYDGELVGQPFRHVAKTFQARTWRECQREWVEMKSAERAQLEKLLPPDHGLNERKRSVKLV